MGIERILDIESPEEDGYRFRPALDIETFWKGLSEAVLFGCFFLFDGGGVQLARIGWMK